MENQRKKGSIYEQKAAAYLKTKGYQILAMNYRCRFGEIDIVARDGEYLVFVEVKYRFSIRMGEPEEAVTFRKKRTISAVGLYYKMEHHLDEMTQTRFDVVTILNQEIHLYTNAFEYIGG